MPFSMDYAKDQLTLKGRFPLGYPPKKFADFLFIQHMLSSLESGGKIATICSTGILFRGHDELKVRRSLIERDVIEAVIAVPNNLFQNTGTTVAILVLRKRSLRKSLSLEIIFSSSTPKTNLAMTVQSKVISGHRYRENPSTLF